MARKPEHRPQALRPPTWVRGGRVRAAHRRQPTAAELEATRATSRRAAQGRCATTLTERFHNPACRCPTYPTNLGPCVAFEAGGNGRCVYCDHEHACHPAEARDAG